MEYLFITGDDALRQWQRQLLSRGNAEVALDIEGEFNLHVYGERLCLVQIFDGEQLVAVDPVPVSTEALKEFFEDRQITKVMYDAMSDQSLLFKTMDTRIHSIVDLKPAVDLLEYPKRDLGSVLSQALGVTIEKKSRFQRYNWTTRPLAQDAVEYALSDVAYLFQLRDHLMAELEARGLSAQYEVKNAAVQEKAPDTSRPPRLFRSNEFRRLGTAGQELFRRIYDIRDGYARQVDVPPDMVVPKRQLFALAAGKMAPAALEPNRRVPRHVRELVVRDIQSLSR